MPILISLRNFLTQNWPPRPVYTDADVPAGSQAGRVFLVTGGNAGVGFELCKILYKTGATVYLTARSEEKGVKAIEAILGSVPPNTPGTGRLKLLLLDLNDFQSVKDAARSFSIQESRLDILWNNAGVGGNAVEQGARTVQGLEPFVGIHCVAPLLFAQLLLPQLKAASAAGDAASPRIIWPASALIDTMSPKHGVDFSLLDSGHTNGTTTYAMSRAGAWMLSREFAKRHGADGIISVPANPGNLDTGMFNGTPEVVVSILRHTMLYDPVLGAYTDLYAGLSPDISLRNNGIYIFPWGRLRSDDALVRQDIVKAMLPEAEGGLGYASKFWDWCERQWSDHA